MMNPGLNHRCMSQGKRLSINHLLEYSLRKKKRNLTQKDSLRKEQFLVREPTAIAILILIRQKTHNLQALVF